MAFNVTYLTPALINLVPNTFTHSDFKIVQSSLQDVRLVIKLTSLFQSFKSLGGVCYKSLAPFPIHAR